MLVHYKNDNGLFKAKTEKLGPNPQNAQQQCSPRIRIFFFLFCEECFEMAVNNYQRQSWHGKITRITSVNIK